MIHGPMQRYQEEPASTARLLKNSDTDGLFERFLIALGFEGDDGWRWLADNVILAGRHSREFQRLVRAASRGEPVARQRQLEVESHVVGGVALALYAFELRAQGTPLGDL